MHVRVYTGGALTCPPLPPATPWLEESANVALGFQKPFCPHSAMGGGDKATGKCSGNSNTLEKEKPEMVSQERMGPVP